MNPLPIESRTKLNLGCGRKKFPDYVNLDVAAAVEPDVVHDLDQFPYPFPDSRFDDIVIYDVIEHIADVPKLMAELWRLGKPGARIIITTPHFSSANSYTDPTHKRHLGYFSMDYFSRAHPLSYYGGVNFDIVQRQMVFHPTLINRVVHRMARRWPSTYEHHWAWIVPAWYLFFELKVAK